MYAARSTNPTTNIQKKDVRASAHQCGSVSFEAIVVCRGGVAVWGMQESSCNRIVSFVADHSPRSPLLAMSLRRAPGIGLVGIHTPRSPKKALSVKGIKG